MVAAARAHRGPPRREAREMREMRETREMREVRAGGAVGIMCHTHVRIMRLTLAEQLL
jgi:hypothetical protein